MHTYTIGNSNSSIVNSPAASFLFLFLILNDFSLTCPTHSGVSPPYQMISLNIATLVIISGRPDILRHLPKQILWYRLPRASAVITHFVATNFWRCTFYFVAGLLVDLLLWPLSLLPLLPPPLLRIRVVCFWPIIIGEVKWTDTPSSLADRVASTYRLFRTDVLSVSGPLSGLSVISAEKKRCCSKEWRTSTYCYGSMLLAAR